MGLIFLLLLLEMPWNQLNVNFWHGMIFFVLRNFIKSCFGLPLPELQVILNHGCFHGREWNCAFYLWRRTQIRWNMELVEWLKNVRCWGNHRILVSSVLGWKKTLFGGGCRDDRVFYHYRLNFGTLPVSHWGLHAPKYLKNILYKINPILPSIHGKKSSSRCPVHDWWEAAFEFPSFILMLNIKLIKLFLSITDSEDPQH